MDPLSRSGTHRQERRKQDYVVVVCLAAESVGGFPGGMRCDKQQI